MGNIIKHFSTDMLYTRKRLNSKISFCFFLLFLVILFLISLLLFNNSVQLNGKIINVGYSESVNTDYKVYLKENDYYDSKFLPSGMQYISNIIKCITPSFNYEIHADKNIDFNYKYKITGELIISDPADVSKILYTKTYDLSDEKEESINSNNFVINEDVYINYDYYNNYVNSYRVDYGLSVNSKLVVTMDIKVDGKYEETEEKLKKEQKLQISIPLSEQTLNIKILSDNINGSGNLTTPIKANIKNKVLFVLAILILLVSILGICLVVYLFLQNRKKNIYNITVNKILKEYDRIIVNGNVELNEDDIPNKIYPETFEEMVDASQTLNSPIVYYEVIKDEKCFFAIIKNGTMYKYRLTRDSLEKKDSESLYEEDMKNKNITNRTKKI